MRSGALKSSDFMTLQSSVPYANDRLRPAKYYTHSNYNEHPTTDKIYSEKVPFTVSIFHHKFHCVFQAACLLKTEQAQVAQLKTLLTPVHARGIERL